jgi:hypothetical protein
VVLRDALDHLLDEDGLADAGAAEQADLAACTYGVSRSMTLMPVSNISVFDSSWSKFGALRWMPQRSVISMVSPERRSARRR